LENETNGYRRDRPFVNFSTVPELHSGQLGLLSGILIGIIYWHGYRRSSFALCTAFYLLALGIVPASTRVSQ